MSDLVSLAAILGLALLALLLIRLLDGEEAGA